MTFQSLFYLLIETALVFPVAFAVLLGLPIMAVLWVIASRRRAWSAARKPAMMIALMAGLVAFVWLPALFSSSLQEMNYIVDWLFHISCTMAIMVYIFLVSWFLLAPIARRKTAMVMKNF